METDQEIHQENHPNYPATAVILRRSAGDGAVACVEFDGAGCG